MESGRFIVGSRGVYSRESGKFIVGESGSLKSLESGSREVYSLESGSRESL